MTNERLKEIINNVLDWGRINDDEFKECLIMAMDLTEEETKELQLEDYVREEELTDGDYEGQFGSEMAVRICRANGIPLSDIEKYGSDAYWINDAINNLQDLYDINESFVLPTGDEELIRDYRVEILEEEE